MSNVQEPPTALVEQVAPAVSNVQGTTTVAPVFESLDADNDSFSDLGSSIGTDVTSLSSSIRNHVYENGRRYHSLSAGTYSIPNDEGEQERLDMYHHATSLLLQGALHVATLPEKLDRILDLGTGTGIWAIDMADEHPESSVLGVDLSPIQPSWVPSNCTFEVDDLTKPWVWKEPFNFIHSANISQGIRDWPEYVKRIYDNLVPGGVVEIRESQTRIHTDDGSRPKGGYLEKYEDHFIKSATMAGIDDVCEKLQGFVEDAGFVDVRVIVKKLPFGPWPKDPKKKELGKWGLAIVEQGFKSYGIALFTRYLEMSTKDAEELCDRAFDELRSRDVHTYAAEWFIEGRKPFAGEA